MRLGALASHYVADVAATPVQAREVLTAKLGELLEFTENPDSSQYLQSRKYWPDNVHAGGLPSPGSADALGGLA